MTGPARRPPDAIHVGRVRRKPVGSLPSGLLAEAGAELGQARIGGRSAKRPSGLAFLVRIVDIVISRVDLDGARQCVVAASIGIAESPKVHLPEVEAGLAIDDPFRHCPAHATRTGDPVGAEACRDVQPANARFAENAFVVWRKGFRPGDQLDYVAVLE